MWKTKMLFLIKLGMHNLLEKFENIIKNCKMCNNRRTPVTGLMKINKENETINDPNIMLIGLTPKVNKDGEFDMNVGVGIRRFFGNISFSRGFCFDNIIKCALKPDEINKENFKCFSHLLSEINWLKPKHIIFLGCDKILNSIDSKYLNKDKKMILNIPYSTFKHFSYFLYKNNKEEENEYYFNIRMKIAELEGLSAF